MEIVMIILRKIWLIVLIILGVAWLAKNFIIKTTITSAASKILGAELKIKSFSAGLFTQTVKIKDAMLYNPPGFPPEPFIDIPEISVHYDLPALIQGKLHFPSIVLSLKEVVIIKNQKGELNVNSLKVVQKPPTETKTEPKIPTPQGPQQKPSINIQIDEMTLNIERVISKDYTIGDPPVVKVLEIPLKNKTFKNITSPEQMVVLILVQALGPSMVEGAKLYATAAILGVGFLPAGVAGVLLGKDNVSQEFTDNLDTVYKTALMVIKQQRGETKTEDKAKSSIRARMDGHDVIVKLEQLPNHHIKVSVSARKLLLPKPEFAGGLLYEISQKLGK